MKYNKQEDTVKLDKFEVINLAWDLYKMRERGNDFNPTSKKWLDFLHPKSVEEVYELLQKIIKHNE